MTTGLGPLRPQCYSSHANDQAIAVAPDNSQMIGTIRASWANLPPKWRVVSAILAAWDVIAWLFIGLKLAGVIIWSWWWVFAPIWVCAAVMAMVISFALLFFGLHKTLEYLGDSEVSL